MAGWHCPTCLRNGKVTEGTPDPNEQAVYDGPGIRSDRKLHVAATDILVTYRCPRNHAHRTWWGRLKPQPRG